MSNLIFFKKNLTTNFSYVILVNVSEVSIKLNEKIWKKLCKKYNKHCYFSEVENLTVEEAEKYIQDLKVVDNFGR